MAARLAVAVKVMEGGLAEVKVMVAVLAGAGKLWGRMAGMVIFLEVARETVTEVVLQAVHSAEVEE